MPEFYNAYKEYIYIFGFILFYAPMFYRIFKFHKELACFSSSKISRAYRNIFIIPYIFLSIVYVLVSIVCLALAGVQTQILLGLTFTQLAGALGIYWLSTAMYEMLGLFIFTFVKYIHSKKQK